jgi:hypothetical protein
MLFTFSWIAPSQLNASYFQVINGGDRKSASFLNLYINISIIAINLSILTWMFPSSLLKLLLLGLVKQPY